MANATNHDDPAVCTVECQTYVTVESLEAREKELAEKRLELLELQAKVSLTGLSKDEFAKNEAKTKFYTGLPNFLVLLQVFNLCEPWISQTNRSALTKFEQLILALMRLKLNLSLQDVAYRFCISTSTASRVFNKLISILHLRLQFLIQWPAREILRATMPMDFRNSFGNKIAVMH